MKKIMLLAALLLSLGAFASGNRSDADGVEFLQADLSQALERAGEEGKYLFVELYATWCPACGELSRTLRNEEVGRYMNERFVSVRYDVDLYAGRRVAGIYKVESLPTMLVLDAEGNVVGRLVGAARPAQFLDYMKRLVAGIR